MSDRADVVIVGAGQGGAHTAIMLRQQKFAGSIVILGAEPELPYERPALSKEYLADEKSFDALLLRPASAWHERNVDIRRGQRVLEVADHRVRTADLTLEYGKLVWATGGRPRKLTCGGHELAGVHYIRDRADVDRMKRELDTIDRVVVVGGGFIGLEAAAVLRKLGKSVTVLEAQERLLARVAGETLARFFEDEHRAKGVDLRLGATVTALEGVDRVAGVRLASGELLPAELVVVGIGIDPVVQPLGTTDVDLECKTSLPDVYAIGDCASHPNIWANGKTVHIESIQNANDQAAIVAKSITGTEARYEAVPWFWSNQYDLRLQTVGLAIDYDDVVVRGDPAARSFSVVHLRGGKVVAVDCVNQTKDYMQGKALIASGRVFDRDKLKTAVLRELL